MIKKRFYIIFLLLISTSLLGQIKEKISAILSRDIEYRTPFKISVIDLKLGMDFLNTNAISFDSTESELAKFDKLPVRSLNSIELDLLKINYLYYLFRQNFIDLQTGIGIKYNFPVINLGLPYLWQDESNSDHPTYYFAPRIIEYYISNSIIYQWTPRFFNYFQANIGKAYGELYKTRDNERYLKHSGMTYSFALGFKRLGNPARIHREGIGLEIKYSFANFKDCDDPDNISPIKNVDYSRFGISLSFSPVFGGNPTVADQAKELYKSGNYISAKAKLEKFLEAYPKHPKRKKAQKMILKCNEKIPFQKVDIADSFLKEGNLSQTKTNLSDASVTTDMELSETIDERYARIANWFRNDLDSLLSLSKIKNAEERLNQLENLKIPGTKKMIDSYWSEIYFHRAVVFVNYRYWERSIYYFDQAIKKNPIIKERASPYLLKIAYGYIEDANLSVSEENINLALESLRESTRIRPDLFFLTNKHIENLEKKIDYLEISEARNNFDNDRDKKFDDRSRQIRQVTIGMDQKDVLEILGNPQSKNYITDHLGQEFQLWIFVLEDKVNLSIYFQNGKVQKIENK